MSGDTSRRLGSILAVAVLLAACAGEAPSRIAATPTALPPATLAAAACPPPAVQPTAWPDVSGDWPGLNPPRGLSAAGEAEIDELMAAVGNPDLATSSPDWDAFEASLSKADAPSIRASADEVLRHLQAACAAVAPYFDEPGAQSWAADVRGLFDGIAASVAGMRDGAIAGSPAAVESARGRMQLVMLDHFWQSIKGGPEGYRVTMPDGRSATASHVRWSTPVGNALDGNPATMWTAGDVPGPQWIELDFGWEATISRVRLLAYQETAGPTEHVVTVRTATGEERELTRFIGDTRDEQWLEFTAPSPVENVRYVRVSTLRTPSMIGWRELEVSLAKGAVAGPCPGGAVFTSETRLRSEPSTGPSDPRLGVDGDETTGWDPGPVRGVDGARGWIRVFHASQFEASKIRVLTGPGSAAARYEVVLFPRGELGTGLGVLQPTSDQGGWMSIDGPNPCLPYESIYIFVRSVEPPGAIREIQVTGSAAE